VAPFDVVLTLGPSSSEPAVLERLACTARRFRLNGSHLTPDELTTWLGRIAALPRGPVPVVVDLQGAKMRLADYPTTPALAAAVELVCTDAPPTDPAVLPIPHQRLFNALAVGDELSLNDDRVRLVVTAVGRDVARASVVRNGPCSAGKGVNRRSHPIELDELLARDRTLVAAAERFSFVTFALSFVHSSRDAALVRACTERPVAAKIERSEAMADLPAIAAAFDEVWFCRGDLGAQAGLAELGPLQVAFERIMPAFTRPSLLAGQILEHMTVHGTPTRAEVVALHHARLAGWSGVVLSDETAVGRHPTAVADLLDLLLAAGAA